MNFYDIEIEQCLLGGLLANPVPLKLSEEDFHDIEHYRLFRDIQGGKRVKDYVGTKEFDYVRSLVDGTITHFEESLQDYADVLKGLTQKRKLHDTAKTMLEMLDGKDATEVAAYAQGRLENTISTNKIMTSQELTQIIANETELPPNKFSTGFKGLDNVTGGGLYEGFTYGFCGAEKMGKTTLAHTLSFQLNTPHLYVAMEMGAKQIHQRNIARAAGFNSLEFYKGTVKKGTIETAKTNDNAYYADLIGANLDEILSEIRVAKIKYKITGFILDYWQLVQGQERGQSEEKHLRDVAQGVANFARKNKLWCVLLAQMNQDGKLFGGNGLRKACDQLYMIRQPEGQEHTRWLEMDASRYTIKANLGSEERGWVMMDLKSGPYFFE